MKEKVRELYKEQIPNMIPEFDDKILPPAAWPPVLKNGNLESPEVFTVAIAKQPLIWTNDQDVLLQDIYKTFHQNPQEYPGDSSREENDWVVQRENKRTIDKSLHGKRVGDTPKQVQTTDEQGI